MIVLVVLAPLPHVKRFIDHQHAETVTGIEQLLRWRIMTGSNGIESIFFEDLDLSFFGAVNRCRTKRSIVMMHATSTEFQFFSIEQKSVACIYLNGANSKMSGYYIYNFLVL